MTTLQRIRTGTATGQSDLAIPTPTQPRTISYNKQPFWGCDVLIVILIVLTGSYAGLWALRFVLEQRPDTE